MHIGVRALVPQEWQGLGIALPIETPCHACSQLGDCSRRKKGAPKHSTAEAIVADHRAMFFAASQRTRCSSSVHRRQPYAPILRAADVRPTAAVPADVWPAWLEPGSACALCLLASFRP